MIIDKNVFNKNYKINLIKRKERNINMGFSKSTHIKWTANELRTDFTDKEVQELEKKVRTVHGPTPRELLKLIESGELKGSIDFAEGSFYAFKRAVEEGKYDNR